MPRGLSADEASLVSAKARPDGQRPTLYSSVSDTEEEISSDFEVYLILTDPSLRNKVANFFQTILDNNPNDLDVRSRLLNDFIQEEIRNSQGKSQEFSSLTSFYDEIRSSYGATINGFTDIAEVVALQEALTLSLGPIAEQRDRLTFNYSALNVLLARANSSGSDSFTRELESWIRLLVEYE